MRDFNRFRFFLLFFFFCFLGFKKVSSHGLHNIRRAASDITNELYT